MLAGTRHSLGSKIIGMLLVFFLFALCAIGVTLFVSWQLKGASAAINDAGSLRMKAYQIGHHLNGFAGTSPVAATSVAGPQHFAATLEQMVLRMEHTLHNLQRGDPARPLFIPRGDGIPATLAVLIDDWRAGLRPVLQQLRTQPPEQRDDPRVVAYTQALPGFVADIDTLVVKMERSYARSTNILQMSQVALLLLAVAGTLILIRFFFVQVIRPLGELTAGVAHWARDDFSHRLEVTSEDEFGRLAEGFNRTAGHLQDLYATLEQRVADKTRSLSEKHRQLGILYATSDFLSSASDVDGLCRGFLQQVMHSFRASAGAVRLLDREGAQLCITVGEGLQDDFLSDEAVLSCNDCLCGAASRVRGTLIAMPLQQRDAVPRETCRKAGFALVTATAVVAGKRTIGVFNLYFAQPGELPGSDRQLLETLGQQLGAAIEGLRLQARARELAVSEERNLIARELHDSIAQALAFMNLQVQMLEGALGRGDERGMRNGLRLLHQGLQESYDDVRELMVHFRARVGEHDLDKAIGDSLRRLSEQSGIATSLDVQGGGAPLDPEVETQVLYIVQEALSNVRKHASARSVQVRIRRALDGLDIQVRDDGSGIPEDTLGTLDTAEHIGMEVMRERARGIGGRLSIHSRPGQGTQVSLSLPRRAAGSGEENECE